MAKAVLCPVCKGFGKVVANRDPNSSAADERTNYCHGCGGKGWVEVDRLSAEQPGEKAHLAEV
mgnify:CR=1 FL=1